MHAIKLKIFIPSILLFGITPYSLSATQNMPIRINGTFSNAPLLCQITDNSSFSNFTHGPISSKKMGQETGTHKIPLSIDCRTTVSAQLSFTAPASVHSSQLFQTSSKAHAVKLSWQGEAILPNKSIAITMTQNQKIYYLDAALVRIAPNTVGDYGEHSFNLAGNLAIDYP
ncbi:hypothetical protein ACBQ54_07080 [Providencia vermicola]|uniref:hypothetical protein n=1 Tax=Providencia TaxID=586 RepID=UPI00234949EB|nr:hypothetical protein [Providencia sp. PROV259]